MLGLYLIIAVAISQYGATELEQCRSIEAGYNYPGFDLEDLTNKKFGSFECHQRCISNADCRFWIHSPFTGECWIKNKDAYKNATKLEPGQWVEINEVRCTDDSKTTGFSMEGVSPNEGNVFYNGGPICHHDWDDDDARVFCRMFGYQDGTATHGSKYGLVFYPPSYMQQVHCNGDEDNLVFCPHRNDGTSTNSKSWCSPHHLGGDQAAGVICSGSCEVHVGNSDNNKISATVSEGCAHCCECPATINKKNWLGGYGEINDEFAVTQDGSALEVKRTDADHGWGMDLKFMCPRLGSCEVHVGNSDDNTKSAIVTEGCVCPEVINKNNWLVGDTNHDYAQLNDAFAVTQDGSTIEVKRTDADHGWGMDLKFICSRQEFKYNIKMY